MPSQGKGKVKTNFLMTYYKIEIISQPQKLLSLLEKAQVQFFANHMKQGFEVNSNFSYKNIFKITFLHTSICGEKI